MSVQVGELTGFQQNLYDLERAHQQMKVQYEEEIMRLRRDIDPNDVNKRPRLDDSAQNPMYAKAAKTEGEMYQRVSEPCYI